MTYYAPSPMPDLSALEARARLVWIRLRSVSSTRYLDLDFVAHEPAFVIFRNALFGGLCGLEFLACVS